MESGMARVVLTDPDPLPCAASQRDLGRDGPGAAAAAELLV